MLHPSSWRLSAITLAVALAACNGGDDATPADGSGAPPPPEAVPGRGMLAGQVYKGPVAGATVCVHALAANGAKGTLVAAQPGSSPVIADGCVVTGSNGSYAIVLPPGTRGALLVESTGGTFCSNEAAFDGSACPDGGAPVAMGSNVLQTVVEAPSDGVLNAPVTLLTTAAAKAPGTLSPESFRSSYGTIASNFGVPSDPASPPSSGELATGLRNLALYVGTSTGDLAEIVSGIASGTLVASNTTFPVGIELVVGGDQKSVHLFRAGPGGVQRVSTAELPGIPGTYSRSGNTVTVTMPNHGLRTGLRIPLNFGAGTGGTGTSGTYPVTVVNSSTFTVTDAAAGTITGGTLFRDPVTRLAASYSQQAGDATLTITLQGHGLSNDDTFDLKFADGSPKQVLLDGSAGAVVDANTIQVNLGSPAAATGSGPVEVIVGANYAALDAVMHPSGKWLYVSSAYDCDVGGPYCLSGDAITTFRIDWQRGRLTLLRADRAAATGSQPYPTSLVIDPAGTKLAQQDSPAEAVALWSIDPATGALTYKATAQGANQAGLTFSPSGRYVYSGSRPFEVTADSIAYVRSAGQYNGGGGDIIGDVLFFTSYSSNLYAVSVASPASPTRINSLSNAQGNCALSTRNGSVIVAAGNGAIRSYRFANDVLSVASPAIGASVLERGGASTPDALKYMAYCSVHLDRAGGTAVATYGPLGASRRGDEPSGYLFANVGADGQLTRLADLPLAKYARTAKYIKQP